LAKRATVELRELAQETFLGFAPEFSPDLHRQIRDGFARLSFTPAASRSSTT
jgi:hypothetical protein